MGNNCSLRGEYLLWAGPYGRGWCGSMYNGEQDMTLTKLTVALLLPVASAIAGGACVAQTESPKHTIVVTFDYDFTAVPACSEKVTKKCIAKFVVYDISGKNRTSCSRFPFLLAPRERLRGFQEKASRFSSSLGNTYWEFRRRGKADKNQTRTPLPSGRRFRRRPQAATPKTRN